MMLGLDLGRSCGLLEAGMTGFLEIMLGMAKVKWLGLMAPPMKAAGLMESKRALARKRVCTMEVRLEFTRTINLLKTKTLCLMVCALGVSFLLQNLMIWRLSGLFRPKDASMLPIFQKDAVVLVQGLKIIRTTTSRTYSQTPKEEANH